MGRLRLRLELPGVSGNHPPKCLTKSHDLGIGRDLKIGYLRGLWDILGDGNHWFSKVELRKTR